MRLPVRFTSLRLVLLVMAFACGCDSGDSPRNYRALPVLPSEMPVVNPPMELRQQNRLGGPNGNEGSCVHASLRSMMRWQNLFADSEKMWSQYSGGEYSSRLRSRLDAAAIKYAFTESSNLSLLDYAHETRRGALLWWKPSHCCTFCGWVDVGGKTFAVILDNNKVNQYELTERSQFHRLWAGYGGFALTTLGDPPGPPLYRSFERVAQNDFFDF